MDAVELGYSVAMACLAPKPGQLVVRGCDMQQSLQAMAKEAFRHRFTGDHRPTWVRMAKMAGTSYPLQFATDADWLTHSWFLVRTRGNYLGTVCHSQPTWPENPELR